jgi:N-acetylneuraminate synthase
LIGRSTNAPLLLHLARFRLPIILSTGIATLAEVEQALGVIARLSRDVYAAVAGRFLKPSADRETWTELRARVTLLHCTTEYPAEPQSINLRAMATLHDAFGLPVGFPITAAVFMLRQPRSLGAAVIEKHLTSIAICRGPITAPRSNPTKWP